MLTLRNVSIPLGKKTNYRNLCASELKTSTENIRSCRLIKRSVDARKKNDVHFSCSFEVEVKNNEQKIVRSCKKAEITSKRIREKIVPIRDRERPSPIVVGSGPAGLFCALTLAQNGYNPILIERGKPVDERTADVMSFWKNGTLNTESNVQFGEGGTGTFSDGKLNTGTKDSRRPEVLKTFVDFGAPEDILFDAEPHIGTDILSGTVKNIREKIISLGGTVMFSAKLVDFSACGNTVDHAEVEVNGKRQIIDCDTIVLAVGHSARDTFQMLKSKKVVMEPKPFSVGARIEHLQSEINLARYGTFANNPELPPASYKLAAHIDDRGVYTFCMCPGGTVVAAASENEGTVTNGMSYHSRDGVNSNSALLVGVDPKDFGSDDVLAGMEFQRKIERTAYSMSGSYRAPCQRICDFFDGKKTNEFGSVIPTYTAGVSDARIDLCLPEYVVETMKAGITRFGKMISGFDIGDALITGPETRSSSPVRILRGDGMMSSVNGLYPCGEGAGYAGGIVSAAVDGIRVAEAIMSKK